MHADRILARAALVTVVRHQSGELVYTENLSLSEELDESFVYHRSIYSPYWWSDDKNGWVE